MGRQSLGGHLSTRHQGGNRAGPYDLMASVTPTFRRGGLHTRLLHQFAEYKHYRWKMLLSREA